MLACLGTPDLITVLFFSVYWQTVYYENAIPFLIANKLSTTTTICQSLLKILSAVMFEWWL